MNQPSAPRPYYAARKNGARNATIDVGTLVKLIKNTWDYLEQAGYFVEAFGFHCTDNGFEPGYAGANVEAYVSATTQQLYLWPMDKWHRLWDEDKALTIVEFLFDHVSKPQTKTFHDWNNCGFHFGDFDKEAGQTEYRQRINVLLAQYGDGWELSEKGEVLSLPPQGMATLIDAPLPTRDKTVIQRVEAARLKFRRHGSSLIDRRDAVRDLVDVLEWLRPQIKQTFLKDDEKDLFKIANTFGIRHMRQDQKINYDQAVWLSWMFYYYLNTINAFLHLIKRQEGKGQKGRHSSDNACVGDTGFQPDRG